MSTGNEDVEPVKIAEDQTTKVDELFAPVPKRVNPGQVWVYDEQASAPEKRLRRIAVRTGIGDEQFTELVSGDLSDGATVLTGITPPPSVLERAAGGGLFGQPGPGRGGMTPAGPVGPPVLATPGRGGMGGGGRGGN